MNSSRVLNAPWLSSGPTSRVLQLLNDNGEEARVVGGAVRNALLNIPSGDIDIATTALPAEVVRRAWVGDAHRRDFTINALSVGPDGVVHDYVGGLDDIAARRVRFIGDAGLRIAEDYLRILRFFRIHAAFGTGEVDRAGYLACIAGRAGLATLSAERVRMEVLKLLVADGAAAAVSAMTDAGLLLPIFGGIAYI